MAVRCRLCMPIAAYGRDAGCATAAISSWQDGRKFVVSVAASRGRMPLFGYVAQLLRPSVATFLSSPVVLSFPNACGAW
jgi:hypothetical protein